MIRHYIKCVTKARLFTLLALLSFVSSAQGQAQSTLDISPDSLINRGHMLFRQGEPQLGFDTLFYALEKYDESEDVQVYFDVLTALSFHLYYSDTYGELYPLDLRMKYINKAIALATQLGEDSVYTNKIYHKGVIYNINEELDSAMYFFEATIDWADKISNDNILLQAYYFKSMIMRDRGELETAYEILVEYEKAATRLQNGVHMETVAGALGNFFVVQKDPEKSIHYFKKARDLAYEYNLDAYYSLSSLAIEYSEADSIELAKQTMRMAFDEIERIKRDDEFDQGYAYKMSSATRTMGYIYSDKIQDYDSALYYYTLGLDLSKQLNHKESIAETQENIAGVYQAKGNYAKALQARLDNYDLVNEVGNLNLRIQIESNMAKNYELTGNYAKALEHFRINQQLSDSLLNIQRLEAVAKLETEYETEKKEQEIALLNSENDRQRAKQTGFIAVGVLLFIILVIVFIALRNKQRSNKLITRQKEDLAKSNKELNKLSRFKESLTHMIAHDMKNPLNAILGLSRGEPSKRKFDTISQSGQQMLDMVSNMLDVQKFEEAKIDLSTESQRLTDIVNKAALPLELLMLAKQLQLKTNVPDDLYVQVDGELITRVVGNLLSNAIKFSNHNSVVEIDCKVKSGMVEVSVADHGQGIAPDQVEHVFDKYWQGEAKDSGFTSSTGLGLTFCKLATEVHGGEIGVTSDRQETMFYFTIPTADEVNIVQGSTGQTAPLSEAPALDSDVAVLSKYFGQLQELKVHQVGRINPILKELDKEELSSDWADNLKSAVYQGNQDRYDELVEMLK